MKSNRMHPALKWFAIFGVIAAVAAALYFGGYCPSGKCCHRSGAKGSAVVLFGKRTIVDSEEFNKTIDAVIASNPMLQQFYPVLAKKDLEALIKQIAQGVAQEYAMKQWVEDQKISEAPEYVAHREEIQRALDRDLAIRAFRQKLGDEVVLAATEPKEYYEKNNERRQEFQQVPFLIQAGGVKAEGIIVKNASTAEQLKKELLTAAISVKKAAEDKKAQYQDLGFVNAQSTKVDEAIRNALLAMKKFPAIDIVALGDGKFIVLKASKKQDSRYTEFEKLEERVKEYVGQLVKNEKLEELFSKKMEELKKQYDVTINEEFIQQKVSELRPDKVEATAAAEGEVAQTEAAAQQAPLEPATQTAAA